MKHDDKISLYGVFKQLRSILNRRIKWLLVATLVIGICASLLEVAAIGITLRFLQQIRETSELIPYKINNTSSLSERLNSVLVSGFALIFIINVSAAIRLFSLWFNDKVSAIMANYTIGLIYGTFLNMGFENIKRIKSATIISTLTTYHVELVYTITNMIQLCSATLMAFGILATITFITPMLTLVSIVVIGGAYVVIALTIRKRASRNSIKITNLVEEQLIRVQETWGDIRNIILGSQQATYISNFIEVDKRIRNLKLVNSVFGFLPRFAIEALGITVIAVFSMSCLYFRDRSADILAVVGAFALGTIRLLPYVQNIYSRTLDLRINKPGTIRAIKYIKAAPMIIKQDKVLKGNYEDNEFLFRTLILDDISWAYHGRSRYTFKGINIKIEKGKALGIKGKSGSGKTTLVDIMMALLKPKGGSVYVNGSSIWEDDKLRVNYMRSIHYVNQSIYIKDSTLGCFIANDKADRKCWEHARLIECMEMAGIGHLLGDGGMNLETRLGENASSLSGGERQRLAIARALYLKPAILVLDEPTSALDESSEGIVVNAIRTMKEYSTIILISHRKEPQNICDEVIDMERLKLNNV